MLLLVIQEKRGSSEYKKQVSFNPALGSEPPAFGIIETFNIKLKQKFNFAKINQHHLLMKNTHKFETKTELKLFKKIESGNYKPLSKKDFEKEKARFQKIASNTLKKGKEVDYIPTKFDEEEWEW